MGDDALPCLVVAPCGQPASGRGTFGKFKVSNAKGSVAAEQHTEGSVCWDATGLHIHESATDRFIFSPYVRCNSPVFVNSDVLEVFIAPVHSLSDNPQWYFELDTSPSGVMWAACQTTQRAMHHTAQAVRAACQLATLTAPAQPPSLRAWFPRQRTTLAIGAPACLCPGASLLPISSLINKATRGKCDV